MRFNSGHCDISGRSLPSNGNVYVFIGLGRVSGAEELTIQISIIGFFQVYQIPNP